MIEQYRFSFGPWNISNGADPFGPPVRRDIALVDKLDLYRELEFDGIQLHDDDAVANLDEKSPQEIVAEARQLKQHLADVDLIPEFIAPRLWENSRGIDGGYTSNDSSCRQWAIDRTKKAIDIANELQTNVLVLWLAREGTYIRESKCALQAHQYLLDAINEILEFDRNITIAIEPKPNEPVDQAYLPTIGHALALASQTADPSRVGGLIETAHAQLAGLDPADEMAFALQMNKLWSVHLNDQNGLKYDQDKSFGSVNLRSAFNQVRVLERANYASTGRFVGLDVKAMRTQPEELAHLHLQNSKETFLNLVEKVRTFPEDVANEYIERRDYESVEMLVMKHLIGVSNPVLEHG